MTYIVTKRYVYEPDNEVYFCQSLDSALEQHARLEEGSGKEWLIAVVLEDQS